MEDPEKIWTDGVIEILTISGMNTTQAIHMAKKKNVNYITPWHLTV